MHTRNSILPYHQLTAAFTKQSDVCWDHRHTEQGLWKLLLGYKLQNRLEDLNSPAVLRYGTGLGQNCGRSSVGHSLPEPFQMALCYPKHCAAEADKVKKEWLNLNVVKNNLFIFCIQWLRGRLHRHSGLRDKSLGSLRKAFWMVDLSFKSYRIRPVRKQSWHIENFQAIHTSWEGLRKDVPGFLHCWEYLGRHQRASRAGRKPSGWGQDKAKKGWQTKELSQHNTTFPKQGGGITHIHRLKYPCSQTGIIIW